MLLIDYLYVVPVKEWASVSSQRFSVHCSDIQYPGSFANRSFSFFSCAECSDLQEQSVFVLPLDLLERSSHEEKARAAIEHFGLVSLSAPGSRAAWNPLGPIG